MLARISLQLIQYAQLSHLNSSGAYYAPSLHATVGCLVLSDLHSVSLNLWGQNLWRGMEDHVVPACHSCNTLLGVLSQYSELSSHVVFAPSVLAHIF
ncbi:hypothetical protein BU23DRAFT_560439 [Bimuria novae-zelandiae CBS 107.79]|uniref:Uncharacterized protein n=1 Tax=Bimuria novae-zelandiae CBS 107.79 TaxID=1447943 RepID=A0A6A5UN61_9PLEO|nr:hypothetical protein BU23DRAFT_560439 [Bimuria novae-zelandiae CBS 107.79]